MCGALQPCRDVQVRGVVEVQDLHVWGLKPGVPLLAAHLVIRPSANPQSVLDAATKACQAMSISHSTIQARTPAAVLAGGPASGAAVAQLQLQPQPSCSGALDPSCTQLRCSQRLVRVAVH